MADEVTKAVIITLKVVADSGNAKATQATQKMVSDGVAAQVAEYAKATKAAAKEGEKRVADAERAADREAAAALKAYSRIMREREKQSAAAERAYDREAADAQKAYSRIMRSRAAMASAIEGYEAKSEAMTRSSSRKMIEMGSSVLQVGQGIATLGVLSEDTTEKMLKGLIKVQGGFMILQGLGKGYLDLSEAAHGYAEAAKAAAKAQELLATSRVGVGVATGAATAGGAAASAGASAAGAAGGTAVAGAGAGLGIAALAKTALGGVAAALTSVYSVGLAVTLVGQEIGAKLGLWESLTGALTGWWKASSNAAESTKKLTAAEAQRARGLAMVAAANERAAAQDAQLRQERGMRETLQAGGRALAGGSDKFQSDKQRGQLQQEIAAEQKRLESANATQASRTGPLKGATGDVDASQARQLDNLNQLAQLDQRRLENARAIKQQQQETVVAMRDQFRAAMETVQAEKQRHQSEMARFGDKSANEQAEIVRLDQKLTKGEKLTRQEEDFLKAQGMFSKETQAAAAERGKGVKGSESVVKRQTEGTGLGVEKAERAADYAGASLGMAEEEVAKTTMEIARHETAFAETLGRLAEAMDRVAKSAAQKSGAKAGSVTEAGGEEVDAAGQTVASSVEELKTTMVAALDGVDASLRQAIDEIGSRAARRSSVQSAMS